MKLAIRGKILAGMFAVVAVFAACGGFSMFQAQSVAGKARSFIEDDWAATDLIMETRITLGEVAKTVTAPPADLDAEGYIRETRQALAQIEEAFRASVLDAETVEEINHLLERSAAYLVEPLSTYAEPMDRMEAADASAEAVMDAIGPLGSIELARILSTATMTFNDVLISGDLEEFVRFDEAASAMEEHPDYETFREPFLRYRASAEAVFDAAMELDEARGIFLSSADTLDQTLEEFEERFAATVVEPEKADILARLASIVWVLLGAILVAAVIGLLIGYFLARSIARPMARTV
ncbi:hypothetical protein [Desulfuromonas sp.]|uniref:hypothetical protein n=1 Tax=Desulfuromonas sp. TaxID=892 RepID=UPI0025C27F6C|nr:hypothetical protein [Desulfuromonas sp.]